MRKIILASSSPRRKEILTKLNLSFKVVASKYQENMSLKMLPGNLAKFLSQKKAEEIAKKYKDSLVIGADTFVVLNNELLGKPGTPAVAEKMLCKISGKTLGIVTGFTIIDSATQQTFSKAKVTKVFIKELSQTEIKNYIATNEPLDKAGAFAIQGIGAILIEKIEGDYLNAVGLSPFELTKALKKFGVNIL